MLEILLVLIGLLLLAKGHGPKNRYQFTFLAYYELKVISNIVHVST